MANSDNDQNQQEQFVSLASLAARWQLSVTGARNICQRAGDQNPLNPSPNS